MSTHIEDAHVAITLPHVSRLAQRPYTVCCSLGGDNNCFDGRTGERSRDWSVVAIGDCEWMLLTKIVERSSSICGGCLKYRSISTPENYIKAWRKTVEQPLSWDAAKAQGIQIHAYADFPALWLNPSYRQTRRNEFGDEESGVMANIFWVKVYGFQFDELYGKWPSEMHRKWGADWFRFAFDISDENHFRKWEAASGKLEISGPKHWAEQKQSELAFA